MQIPMYQVDAFTRRVFSGNPAAVCPLESWLDDRTLQAIALENNLAETAFFVPEDEVYHLRWFTPACEVDLCGHATLASAFVLMEVLGKPAAKVSFRTRSGMLHVTHDGDFYALDFPSRPPQPVDPQSRLTAAIGATPLETLKARDYLLVYSSEEQVRSLKPDMQALATLDAFAVIVTAAGANVDFVSRFFAPARGIPEDPVTGSAHCTLTSISHER